MTEESFTLIVTSLAVGAAALMLVGFLALAMFTDSAHRRAAIRDNLIVLSPGMFAVGLMLLRFVTNSEDAGWWVWAWVGVLLLALVQPWLPPVRRARARLKTYRP